MVVKGEKQCSSPKALYLYYYDEGGKLCKCIKCLFHNKLGVIVRVLVNMSVLINSSPVKIDKIIRK